MRILLVLFLVGAASVTMPDPGEEIFNDLCSDCHTLTAPPDLGPPLFDVVDRYLAISRSPKAARDALRAWIADPENMAPAMPDSVLEEFGDMPDFGLDSTQVANVTDWLLRQHAARTD